MATLIDDAMAYEPPTTKNIAELDSVPTNIETEDKEFTDSDGKPFTVKVIKIEGEDYRVPTSVLSNLKAILEENPALKKFKVKKSGTGMNTKYTVIPLE